MKKTIAIKKKNYWSHLMICLVMIADDCWYALQKKNLSQAVTELFIRGRKLSIPLVFIPQSYFAVTKY